MNANTWFHFMKWWNINEPFQTSPRPDISCDCFATEETMDREKKIWRARFKSSSCTLSGNESEKSQKEEKNMEMSWRFKKGGMTEKKTFRICCVFLEPSNMSQPVIQGTLASIAFSKIRTPAEFKAPEHLIFKYSCIALRWILKTT